MTHGHYTRANWRLEAKAILSPRRTTTHAVTLWFPGPEAWLGPASRPRWLVTEVWGVACGVSSTAQPLSSPPPESSGEPGPARDLFQVPVLMCVKGRQGRMSHVTW